MLVSGIFRQLTTFVVVLDVVTKFYIHKYIHTLFILETNYVYRLKTKKKDTSRKGSLEVNPM